MTISRTNKLIVMYLAAGSIYGSHYFLKKDSDFLLLGSIFLLVSSIFSGLFKNLFEPANNDSIKKHTDNDDHKHIFMLVSFVYAFLFLTYIKHYFFHKDYDYAFLFIGYMVGSILEYNATTNRGEIEISMYENIRILCLVLIACMYGKHTFSHGKYDYIILSGLYIAYASLLAMPGEFRKKIDLVL